MTARECCAGQSRKCGPCWQQQLHETGWEILRALPPGSPHDESLALAIIREPGEESRVSVRLNMTREAWVKIRSFATLQYGGAPADETTVDLIMLGMRAQSAGPEHEHAFMRNAREDTVDCNCGVRVSGQMIAALGWDVGRDVRRANDLSDQAGKLATELRDLKAENSDLRRKVERLERKR